jgi:hypothetical protein
MNEARAPRSFGKMAIAALILIVAVWVGLHFILGILSFVFSTALLVVVVVAVVWAIRVLF